jgi:inorganic pyrophosphatase
MSDRFPADFWKLADELVAGSALVIDRPAGTRHPRIPDLIYPLDYGYLESTTAMDGGGVDVWRGSLQESVVTGAFLTVDLVKRDAEVKLLVGCTPEEAEHALATHRTGSQAALLIWREPA